MTEASARSSISLIDARIKRRVDVATTCKSRIMKKAGDKVPPEVAAVLAGRNPFVTARPSEVFRDVFDFGDQALHRKDDEDVLKSEKVRKNFGLYGCKRTISA